MTLTSPMTIVLQAASSHADEIEGRQHDDATIAEGYRIRAAVTALRETKTTTRLEADLRFVIGLLPELQGLTPARLELSVEDGTLTAQVIADKIAVPLAGQGPDVTHAARSLVETVEAAARQGRRRRRRRRS